MKIRLTILTENNRPRPAELTEAKVKQAWQTLLEVFLLPYDTEDKCTVESAEFVESEGE